MAVPITVSRMARAARRLIAVALAALVIAPPPARGDALESELKAAYIYNFIRFVEWPVGSQGQITVCVAGPASVKREMQEELEGRKVGDRTIDVRPTASPDDAAHCDVLYVAGRDPAFARRFVAAVPKDKVLTITESDGFPDTGSLINLFLDNQTIRFAVNADLLGASQFKLSSQMLQFGTMVSRKDGGQ